MPAVENALLAVTVAGLRLTNPVIAGSGEATMTLSGMVAALEAGAAAIVAKSTNGSAAAKEQLNRAEYALLDDRWRPIPFDPQVAGSAAFTPRSVSLFNRSGLVDVPFSRWLETLVEADRVARDHDAYVVGSLIPSNVDDEVVMAKEMQAAGLRWIELNVGAPHAREAAPGAIAAGDEAAAVASLVQPFRQVVSIPLTVKVAGQGDVAAMAAAAVEAGADAVCIAGRYPAFVPDVETRRPVLGTFGAIGGAWALPMSLRWIAATRRRLGPDVPLIGTNGARDGLDVARFLLAGARAVEMTTVVMTDGPGALTTALEQLAEYLHRQGRSAEAIVGEAADAAKTYQEVRQ
jgi:dihydroorotate dehydrogenase (NAD+) catalytic subunit